MENNTIELFDVVALTVDLPEENLWRSNQSKALELESYGIDVTPLLIQGATVATILSKADQLDIDLIVIGSHGHSAFSKTWVGSVSEGIIRQASCPVVVVPAKNNN